jgi:hypothetical protein
MTTAIRICTMYNVYMVYNTGLERSGGGAHASFGHGPHCSKEREKRRCSGNYTHVKMYIYYTHA